MIVSLLLRLIVTAAVICLVIVLSLSIFAAILYYRSSHPLSIKAKQILQTYTVKHTQDYHKQGFSVLKVAACEEKKAFDAIVIGSGISGLVVSALLSRLGWKVLCLEQHDVIGGSTHNFQEKGFEFDTGLHYVGGKVGDKKSMFGYLFDILSLGKLTWKPMNTMFDSCALSKLLRNNPADELAAVDDQEPTSLSSFDIPSSLESFQTALMAAFPEEAHNIQAYMRLLVWSNLVPPILIALKLMPLFLTKIVRRFINPLITAFTSMTSEEVLQSLTKNKTLIGLLNWCWGDYGLPPSESAFLMNALLATHYVDGGAFYPVGGSASIAKSMIPMIEAADGKCFVRAPVSKILLDETGCRAIGVHVRGKDIYANTIISSAGFYNTYFTMMPTERENKAVQELRYLYSTSVSSSSSPTRSLRPSCAMFALFVGVEGSPEALGLSAQNKWVFPRWDHDRSDADYGRSVEKIHAFLASAEYNDTADPSEACLRKAVDYHLPLVFISSSTGKFEPSTVASLVMLTVDACI
jgi:all-trans-retinol 13,14-reductase